MDNDKIEELKGILDGILKEKDLIELLRKNVIKYDESQVEEYMLRFIDLLLINKNDELRFFTDLIEDKININELHKCKKTNEFLFTFKDYINDRLYHEFNRHNVNIQIYDEPAKTKPIISLLKNYLILLKNILIIQKLLFLLKQKIYIIYLNGRKKIK